MNLQVAFVGARRPPSDLPAEYWPTFVQYHLELPYYYAQGAKIDVTLVTAEKVSFECEFTGGGTLRCITEEEYLGPDKKNYDVVVHWRKWFDDLYDPWARNVMLSQDHSYGAEWMANVKAAVEGGRLDGILVFPTWHKENTARELRGLLKEDRLYEGMTFGVDTDTYCPGTKDPFHLLWASDPGRGLDALINPFLRLWQKDRRYHLTVTYPDYVKPESVTRFAPFFKHPAVRHLPGVRNGSRLWNLFRDAAFLPYSSTFPEPSSRCHRQAMAAGSVVLYPPNMGTPSCLIENGLTGIVEDVALWPDVIQSLVHSERWHEIGHNARTFSIGENWRVQAQRFHNFFSKDGK